MDLLNITRDYSALNRIVSVVLGVWPNHAQYLEASLASEDSCPLERLEEVAQRIIKLGEDCLVEWAEDYKWLCGKFKEEQLFFFRHRRYRLSSLAEAIEQVYNNESFMSRYMNAVLYTQLFWKNHALSMDLFRNRFLQGCPEGYDYLEVGPGHGLFMSFVAKDPRCASMVGWDLSQSSLEDTREALQKMLSDDKERPQLVQRDIVAATEGTPQFDCIMCSEVLEHTEQPKVALTNMRNVLRGNGQIYLNIPVNSPAPDHIFHWKHPEEVFELVQEAGLDVEYRLELPPTGKSLEVARRHGLDISCIIIAKKVL
jgi:2-polyprenyl-3-methyl-5-hydroxy-6-metoxy-1,4-benzoquinol methylase